MTCRCSDPDVVRIRTLSYLSLKDCHMVKNIMPELVRFEHAYIEGGRRKPPSKTEFYSEDDQHGGQVYNEPHNS